MRVKNYFIIEVYFLLFCYPRMLNTADAIINVVYSLGSRVLAATRGYASRNFLGNVSAPWTVLLLEFVIVIIAQTFANLLGHLSVSDASPQEKILLDSIY
ncbi:hypothetical protein KXD40_006545 [Peronospora effusa]|uniref:Uncharacterized protein n=1 Tax=Peronospora effusa TaxID=542832 RepID=A0A425CCC8_9STRA|nr:hypothetical protein DD237_006650 [Peronospora effusa]UIZ25634.1 hypothetical protein KXD40_006545 [Peronospora effusa]